MKVKELLEKFKKTESLWEVDVDGFKFNLENPNQRVSERTVDYWEYQLS